MRPETRPAVRRLPASRAPTGPRCRCSPPARHARTWRGPRPRCSTCWSGRSFAGGRDCSTGGFVFGMIAQHEQQHDETMLATHQLRKGEPVLDAPPPPPRPPTRRLPRRGAGPRRPVHHGHVAPSRGRWTTNGPRTPWTCPPFWIDTVPVTNARLPGVHRRRRLRRPAVVDPAGWQHGRRPAWPRRCSGSGEGGSGCGDAVRASPSRSGRRAGAACVLVRGDAYARWAGRGCPPRPNGRRPPGTTRRPAGPGATRGETTTRPASTPTSASGTCGRPRRALPRGRVAAAASRQLIGDVWEWTSSDFPPYPGFAAWPYQEYSRGVLRPRLQGAARRLVRRRPGRLPGHVPELGLPDPAADLLRLPLRAGRRAGRGADADVPPSGLRRAAGAAGARCSPSRRRAGPRSRGRRAGSSTATVNADGFGVGWYARRRRRCPAPATGAPVPIWADVRFADLARVIRTGPCWPRSGRPPSAWRRTVRPRAALPPTAAGCSATTARSTAGPASPAALAARLPPGCSRWRRAPIPRCRGR